MRKDERVARFSPPTPRSRRLGRELRRLREERGQTVEAVAKALACSPSRVSRIESGEIRPKPGDVMEILHTFGEDLDGEPGRSLLALARDLREVGWWQRLDQLSNRYATFIAYEAEAVELRNFEPTLVPGLLQTESYARAVNSVSRPTDTAAIEQRVSARMTRQDVLRREPNPLQVHAVLTETALMVEVGGPDVVQEQLTHLVELSREPNLTIQVLRFAAGAHLADVGPFQLLTFVGDEPALGYVETLAGELFLESSKDIERLKAVFNHLTQLAMSPAESARFIRAKAKT